MNMYAYVGGDPVNSADPSGTCAEIVIAHGGDCAEETARAYVANAVANGTGIADPKALVRDIVSYLRDEISFADVKSDYYERASAIQLYENMFSPIHLDVPILTGSNSFSANRISGGDGKMSLERRWIIGTPTGSIVQEVFSSVIMDNGKKYTAHFFEGWQRSVGSWEPYGNIDTFARLTD